MITAALLACAVTLTIPAPVVVEPARMLDAIQAVENWQPGTVGKAGERGRWQIKPITWRTYSNTPQATASAAEERRVALLHLRVLVLGLKTLDLPISPYWVALGWRSGLENIRTHRVRPEWRAYAQRAENVYLSTP